MSLFVMTQQLMKAIITKRNNTQFHAENPRGEENPPSITNSYYFSTKDDTDTPIKLCLYRL